MSLQKVTKEEKFKDGHRYLIRREFSDGSCIWLDENPHIQLTMQKELDYEKQYEHLNKEDSYMPEADVS